MPDLTLPVFQSHPDCKLCSLCENARHPGVSFRWLESSKTPSTEYPCIVVVGMNPGANEDEQNKCFVGRSGQVLVKAYLKNLLHTHTVYLGNCARCVTPAGDPTAKQFDACTQAFLFEDLYAIADVHNLGMIDVLCLGEKAIGAFTKWLTGKRLPMKDVVARQGFVHDLLFEGENGTTGLTFRLFAATHPAACLRTPRRIYVAANQMEMVRMVLEGKAATPTKPKIVTPTLPGNLP